MARTVRDAAILLTAMTGTDPDDSATAAAETHHDYSANLTADALNGKRIGVIRSWYGAGSDQRVDDIYTASIEKLKEAGAVIIDDIKIEPGDMYDAEDEVLLYEFHAETVMPIFGQEILIDAEAKGPLTDEAYLAALETSKNISQSAIDKLIAEHELDAFISKPWNEKQLIEIAYAFEQTTGVRKPPEL